jgi:UDP-glucose 4-epimerase
MVGKRVLVTGGLGFIGLHLCEKLLCIGCDVAIIDNCSSSVVLPDWFLRRAQVFHEDLENHEPNSTYDWVCHLAGPVGPTRVMNSFGNVASDIVKNVDWIVDKYPKFFANVLYISTSEIYGIENTNRETDNLLVKFPYTGRREYSCGKLLGEIILSGALRRWQRAPLIVRPFNVVGPHQSDLGGFVLPRFVNAVRQGQPMTVYGNGKQRRCFTHVKDLVDAIVALMTNDASGVFNVGNPANNTTISQLAKDFARIAKAQGLAESPEITFVDPQVLHGPHYEEVPDKTPDISKLLEMFNWQPAFDLEAILSELVAVAMTEF